MKKMKQLLALVLAVVMIAASGQGLFSSELTQKVQAESSITSIIGTLRSKFPNGKYWNHYVSNESEAGDNLIANNNEAFADSVTSYPCASHSEGNVAYYVGKYDCNYFDGGMQCCGFARKLFYDIHGVRQTSLGSRSDISNIAIGDFIDVSTSTLPHYAIVIGKSGNSLTVAECNIQTNDGSGNCKIRWDHTYSLSQVNCFYHSDSIAGGSSLPYTFVSIPKDAYWYRLKNKNSNQYLVTDEGKKTNETNVSVWQHVDSSDEDEWYALEDSLGYKLTPKNSECILNAGSNSPSAGTNINIFTFLAGDSTQRWKVSRAGDGYIIHLVYNPNLTLGVENGHNVILKNYNSSDSTQIWYFECLDHVWNSGTVTKAATCTASGIKTYTCAVCGGTRTETLPALGHDWSAWTVTKPATATEEGVETRTCSRCTAAETRPIPKPDNPTPVETDLDIEITSVRTQAGKTVTLDVYVTKAAPISYLRVTPQYDASVLTLTGVTNGGLFDTFSQGVNLVFDADEVDATGLLATFTFMIQEDAPAGEYPVTLLVREAYAPDEGLVSVGVTPGAISVLAFVYGDVNGDGVIDGRDVIRLRKYLSDLDEDTGVSDVEIFPGADANGDGTVDGRDLIRLRKYLSNLDEDTGFSPITLGP